MDLRDERGAISGAEGCMFLAMALFALLLVGLLVLAYFRFQERPQSEEGVASYPLPVTSPATARLVTGNG